VGWKYSKDIRKENSKMASTWKSWGEKDTKWGRIPANCSTGIIKSAEGCRQIAQ
jgi:hypothetical protein